MGMIIMKSKKYLYGIVAVAAAIVVMLVIYLVGKPDVTLGSKSVDIAVTDNDGYEKQYFINTEGKYLKQVMDELEQKDFEYSGEEGEYGLYVDTVNGIKADNINAYWAFYVNGEYCNYSIDRQPVNDGDVFEIVYEEIK